MRYFRLAWMGLVVSVCVCARVCVCAIATMTDDPRQIAKFCLYELRCSDVSLFLGSL